MKLELKPCLRLRDFIVLANLHSALPTRVSPVDSVVPKYYSSGRLRCCQKHLALSELVLEVELRVFYSDTHEGDFPE